jgi:DNA-binding CsgD family transcriptional regulator
MNGRRHTKIHDHAEKDSSVHPKSFIFVDKRTGTQHFEVKAGADGSMPVDEAVSLLVVQCLMRNLMPNDFSVMVPAGKNLLDGLRQRARKLMHACPLIEASFQLTSRQQQVLGGIHQGLSNKAIGMKLNLSERTVKFHISALLVKFNVAGRMGLMRKANELLSAVEVPPGVNLPQLGTGEEHDVGQDHRISRERPVLLNALERKSRA